MLDKRAGRLLATVAAAALTTSARAAEMTGDARAPRSPAPAAVITLSPPGDYSFGEPNATIAEGLQAIVDAPAGAQISLEPAAASLRTSNPSLALDEARAFLAPIWRRAHEERALFEDVRQRVSDETAAWDLDAKALLEDSDVLLLGETHQTPTSLVTLTGKLPELREAGVLTIGLESPMNVQLAAQLPEQIALNPRAEQYAELLKEARRLRIRVVMMDPPSGVVQRRALREAAEALGAPPKKLALETENAHARATWTYRKGFNEAMARAIYDWRETVWADALTDVIGGGKAAALVGAFHLPFAPGTAAFGPHNHFWLEPPGSTFAGKLAVWGLRAFSVHLIGGDFPNPLQIDLERAQQAYLHSLAAQAAGDGDRPVFVKTSERTGLFRMPRERR